jgi:hypothetical protein
MSSISRFADGARRELKARPILPFGAAVRLGAVGVVEDDQFSPRGNVESILGGEVGEVSTGERGNWQLTSGADVQLGFLASGAASTIFPEAPKAEAKVEVTFGSSESFLVSVDSLRVSTMTDPIALLNAMIEAFKRGTWRPEFVLVYEVVIPKNALVLLSRQAQTRFLLGAKADVAAPQGTADLAGKFRLRFQDKDAIHLDAGGQPLFFNAFRVKQGFFGGLSPAPLEAGADPIAAVFDTV